MARKSKTFYPHCPVCRAVLRPVVCSGVTVDVCLRCRGLWFDASELERILELPGPVFHTSRLAHTDSEPTNRRCPRRHGSMRSQEIVPGGFAYDRCPACGGLWLDFDRIRLLLQDLGGPSADHREVMWRLERQVWQAQEAQDKAEAARLMELESSHGPGVQREQGASGMFPSSRELTRDFLKLIPYISDVLALSDLAGKLWQEPSGGRAPRRRRGHG